MVTRKKAVVRAARRYDVDPNEREKSEGGQRS